MSKIFISYRRDDSAAYAGRLYDRLVSHFGRGHVFMDIDQIEPGEVFDQVIKDKLAAVQVAVVLIGERWLDIADASGQRRLDNPDDWVRLEITALLERNIRVIPVLVGAATMPKSTQLPECMVPLTRRHALEITSHPRFHTDADKLIKALEKIVGMLSLETPKILEKPEKAGFLRFAVIAGVIAIVLIAGGYLIVMPPQLIPIQPVDPVVEQTAEAARAATYPTQELIAKQPQETIPGPIVQPATEQLKVSVIEPEMVRISPGKFLMGSLETEHGRDSGESPRHEVSIAYAFEIGQYEITFDEYDAFAKDTQRKLPHDRGWGRGKRPVIDVSFYNAQAYVQWLSEKTGKQYRLPTEAEWEYAARAGTQTRYWWGDDIGKNNAVCRECDSEWDGIGTAPVGSFKPNDFKLHDTAGNVWEWTQDCWHDNYDNAPKDGSAWLEKDGGDCTRRVVRGGSWSGNLHGLRSAVRSRNNSGEAYYVGLGFRISRDF